MNLVRGFKRVLIVASLLYWGIAGALANSKYDSFVRDMQARKERTFVFAHSVGGGFTTFDYSKGLDCSAARAALEERFRWGMEPQLKPGGCVRFLTEETRTELVRHVGLMALEAFLLGAAAIYAGILAAIVGIWWIIAGFGTPKAKLE